MAQDPARIALGMVESRGLVGAIEAVDAMVKAATAAGWLAEKAIVLEMLGSMKRAGADVIITYHAVDAARWLREKS